eukprot:760786-Hanusia_phi.AAC.3
MRMLRMQSGERRDGMRGMRRMGIGSRSQEEKPAEQAYIVLLLHVLNVSCDHSPQNLLQRQRQQFPSWCTFGVMVVTTIFCIQMGRKRMFALADCAGM